MLLGGKLKRPPFDRLNNRYYVSGFHSGRSCRYGRKGCACAYCCSDGREITSMEIARAAEGPPFACPWNSSKITILLSKLLINLEKMIRMTL